LSFQTAQTPVTLPTPPNAIKIALTFTMNWARADNTLIKDLKDFTATFFEKKYPAQRATALRRL
jgi:hypothetical protein